jgi:hypothetical protein
MYEQKATLRLPLMYLFPRIQVAMALYKAKPKMPYYFWAVMSVVLQATTSGRMIACVNFRCYVLPNEPIASLAVWCSGLHLPSRRL